MAPLWDPKKRTFLAQMTMSDFVEALRVYQSQNLSLLDLANTSIMDMLNTPKSIFSFIHNSFASMDVEDDVYQLFHFLYRLDVDYVPILDTQENNLVGILGYLDLVYLLAHCAQQYSIVGSIRIDQIQIKNYGEKFLASASTSLMNILRILHEREISYIAIIDEQENVMGLYRKADVTFLAKSPNPDAVMANFFDLLIGDVILKSQQLQNEGSSYNNVLEGFCKCSPDSNLKDILEAMVNFRVTCCVCVDASGRFISIVDIKDILWYFLRHDETIS